MKKYLIYYEDENEGITGNILMSIKYPKKLELMELVNYIKDLRYMENMQHINPIIKFMFELK